jgi:hypothetical protein
MEYAFCEPNKTLGFCLKERFDRFDILDLEWNIGVFKVNIGLIFSFFFFFWMWQLGLIYLTTHMLELSCSEKLDLELWYLFFFFFHLSRIRIGFSDVMHGLVGFYGFNSRFSKIAFFHRYFV